MLELYRALAIAVMLAAVCLSAAARQVTEPPLAPEQNGTAANREAAKELEVKGVALLNEVAEQLTQLRSADNRIRSQVQAAQLLWNHDQPRAKKLIEDALVGLKDYLAGADAGDANYYMLYETAMQLRQEVIHLVAPHDPDLALNFLRGTRAQSGPHAEHPAHGQMDREAQLELSLAGRIALKDPARAQRMIEENLEKGISYHLVEILANLRAADAPAAATLAGRVAAKLDANNLLKSGEAVHVARGLLQLSAAAPGPPRQGPEAVAYITTGAPLLTEGEKRDLLNQMINVALSSSATQSPYYSHSPERGNALNILGTLRSMTAEIEKYAPGRKAALDQKFSEVNNTFRDPQARFYQQYQDAINNGTVDSALAAAHKAPANLRDNLYQQVAHKAFQAGDLARAKEIIAEHITNQQQRQQALNGLEFQAIQRAAGEGKIEEALHALSALRNARERTMMLAQIINNINPSTKKETAVAALERALATVDPAGRAADAEQMNMLFAIARAYSTHEPQRAFEMLETLAEQFNVMSAAAVPLNNFGQQFFVDDELMMRNGNALANIAEQLSSALGPLARADFERAKATADRLQRLEVRLRLYLVITQHALGATAATTAPPMRRLNIRRH